MFIGHPLNRAYWTGLYLVMAGCIIFFRIGIPLYKSFRHNLVVDRVVVEGPGLVSGKQRHQRTVESSQNGLKSYPPMQMHG
jgi:hypothetical protein